MLVASAACVVVPVVDRRAIPKANPAYYLGMAFAVALHLNIVAGAAVPRLGPPVLRRHGGICLTSDAQWLIH